MKIIWKEEIGKDLERLDKRLKNTQLLRKAINKAVSCLQKGEDLSEIYPVNRITAYGTGWFDCYVYKDIVMVYKVRGQRVMLISIGTPKDLLGRK